jgi:hypothetical protein
VEVGAGQTHIVESGRSESRLAEAEVMSALPTWAMANVVVPVKLALQNMVALENKESAVDMNNVEHDQETDAEATLEGAEEAMYKETFPREIWKVG